MDRDVSSKANCPTFFIPPLGSLFLQCVSSCDNFTIQNICVLWQFAVFRSSPRIRVFQYLHLKRFLDCLWKYFIIILIQSDDNDNIAYSLSGGFTCIYLSRVVPFTLKTERENRLFLILIREEIFYFIPQDLMICSWFFSKWRRTLRPARNKVFWLTATAFLLHHLPYIWIACINHSRYKWSSKQKRKEETLSQLISTLVWCKLLHQLFHRFLEGI